MRPPSGLRGWWGGADPGLATYWEAPSDHSITYLRPIDERRVAGRSGQQNPRLRVDCAADLKASSATRAASIRLGPWPNPRVAVSRAGFLAVGGNPRHEIEIYPLTRDAPGQSRAKAGPAIGGRRPGFHGRDIRAEGPGERITSLGARGWASPDAAPNESLRKPPRKGCGRVDRLGPRSCGVGTQSPLGPSAATRCGTRRPRRGVGSAGPAR